MPKLKLRFMMDCFFDMKSVPVKLQVSQVFYFKALEYNSSLMKKGQIFGQTSGFSIMIMSIPSTDVID
jgi:hypothetical protein